MRFVGRARDLATLEAACARGSLVEVWGPPGIGKTRLALELCRRAPRASFCDLSNVHGANDVREHVARAVSELESGLLVLDDCEHVAPMVAAWIEASPRITFVTTSRAYLRLGGETAHELGPLPEARELFMDRVSSRVRFEPDHVDALVARLEGIPLAIELAAARVDVLGVRELLARIDNPIEALDHDGILERTIASSIRSLTPAQRRVFAQCAVFRGAFGLREAEAVIASDALLDVLHSLRDRSLLRCSFDGDVARFAFFEAIRVHAANELRAVGLEDDARRRHALHYLATPSCDSSNLADALEWAFADEAAGRAFAGEAITALARLDASTLTDALVHRLEKALALVSDDCNATLRANGHRAHAKVVALRGNVAKARAALSKAIALVPDNQALAAELWADVGVLEQKLGDLKRARQCYEKALAASEDKLVRARLVGNLGAVAHDLGQLDEALKRYEETIAVYRATGERELEGTFLVNLAVLLQEMGAMPRARATFLMALERLERERSLRMEAIARTNLGLLCHEIGDIEEARTHHEHALALLRQVTDSRSEGLCLGRLAMTLAALGHHDEAATRCERAETILREIGDWHALEVVALYRAYVDLARNHDVTLARERLTHARSISGRSDDARTTMRLVAELAAGGSSARVLVVGPRACWFAPPDGAQCDLSSRQVLRRLLWRLVETHREAPGIGITLDELRVAGWPDDRATALTASNRVHVALTELRRRGLRSCLQREGLRYFIDPAVRVELRD